MVRSLLGFHWWFGRRSGKRDRAARNSKVVCDRPRTKNVRDLRSETAVSVTNSAFLTSAGSLETLRRINSKDLSQLECRTYISEGARHDIQVEKSVQKNLWGDLFYVRTKNVRPKFKNKIIPNFVIFVLRHELDILTLPHKRMSLTKKNNRHFICTDFMIRCQIQLRRWLISLVSPNYRRSKKGPTPSFRLIWNSGSRFCLLDSNGFSSLVLGSRFIDLLPGFMDCTSNLSSHDVSWVRFMNSDFRFFSHNAINISHHDSHERIPSRVRFQVLGFEIPDLLFGPDLHSRV